MKTENMLDSTAILKECIYKTTKSSGAGGQHVNKVETKVILIFNIKDSKVLSTKQKEILLSKLRNKIDKTGSISVSSQKHRSQLKNKKAAKTKLLNLLEKALKTNKVRIPVKVSEKLIEKRLRDKRIKSDIKKFRQKHNIRFEK